jgi:beta-galactosidase
VDQSIRKVDAEGKETWLYGGDFKEEKTHRYFCANGIIFSDRTPHPALYEVKKVYSEIKAHPIDLLRGKIQLENKYSFINLSFINLLWEITENGHTIFKGSIKDIDVKPKEKAIYNLAYALPVLKDENEYHLFLSYRLKEATPWADKGYELAWDQFTLPKTTKYLQTVENVSGTIETQEKEDKFIISGTGFSMALGKTSGGIESLNYGFGELIVAPLVPNYWRALTDNDKGYANFKPELEWLLIDKSWRKATNNRKVKNIKVSRASDIIEIIFSQRVQHCIGDVITIYRINSKGEIEVRHSITPKKDMYKIGMSLQLPNKYSSLTWFGKGPHENYIDRNTGAKIAIHSGEVKSLIHNYMRPQENGNHTEVRWASLTDNNGQGIYINHLNENLLNINAWPYSLKDLELAQHIHELPEREFNTLNIDYVQCGVGGDLPGVANLHEAYKIHKNMGYEYAFTISPIKKETNMAISYIKN